MLWQLTPRDLDGLNAYERVEARDWDLPRAYTDGLARWASPGSRASGFARSSRRRRASAGSPAGCAIAATDASISVPWRDH